jgi:hypothetical protein
LSVGDLVLGHRVSYRLAEHHKPNNQSKYTSRILSTIHGSVSFAM